MNNLSIEYVLLKYDSGYKNVAIAKLAMDIVARHPENTVESAVRIAENLFGELERKNILHA